MKIISYNLEIIDKDKVQEAVELIQDCKNIGGKLDVLSRYNIAWELHMDDGEDTSILRSAVS